MADVSNTDDVLRRYQQQITALATFAGEASNQTPADLRQAAVELVHNHVPANQTAYWQPLPDRSALLLAAGIGWPRMHVGQLNIVQHPVTGEVHALRTRGTVVIDADTAPGLFVQPEELGAELLHAAHVCIGDEQGAYAVLSVYTRSEHSFNAHDLTFMQGVAAVVKTVKRQTEAQAENDRLHQNMRDRTRQIEMLGEELRTYTHLVTHDIREPQRAIEGFTTAIIEDYAHLLDDDGMYMLERIQQASGKIHDQLEGMLDLQRITKADLHRQVIDLSAVADEIRTDLEATDPDRHITWLIDQQVMVNGDRYLMRMALMHLLHNAWMFTQGKPHAQISFGLTRYDDQQVFYVRDNGSGFDMSDRVKDQLFAPFRHMHTDDYPIGRGLGLAIVRRIIHRHGGLIWAESAPGKGAMFYFSIPGIRPD